MPRGPCGNSAGCRLRAVDLEERLAEPGIELSQSPVAIGYFAPGVVFDYILYVSGTYGTLRNAAGEDTLPTPGKLGRELSVAEGYASARQMTLYQHELARIAPVAGEIMFGLHA